MEVRNKNGRRSVRKGGICLMDIAQGTAWTPVIPEAWQHRLFRRKPGMPDGPLPFAFCQITTYQSSVHYTCRNNRLWNPF